MKRKNRPSYLEKIVSLVMLLLLLGGSQVSFGQTNHCVNGCNDNTFINSSDPNTLEYDNLISVFHSSLAKEKNGTFKVWGQGIGNDGTSNLLSPTSLTPANGFNYTGVLLRIAAGSKAGQGGTQMQQFALLTTDGLYIWGTVNTLISSAIKNTTAFGKITVNAKTDGLPAGVAPADVKMMFGSYRTLVIVTCAGEAWVLSANGSKNGDGTIQNTTNDVIWHRVSTAANVPLDNVVAVRGTSNTLFALTSVGKLYTWGTNTYINNGNAANRIYATEISIQGGVIPKMIGMAQGGGNTSSAPTLQTYYLLATNGKLYTMGDNSNRQLGDGSTTTSTIWKEVIASSTISGTTYTLNGNIVWISPNEHSEFENSAAINVLTNNNKQWGWGSNSGNMIGGATNNNYYNPIYMPGNSIAAEGLALTDEVIAVETGGHTTINVKKCSENFGYLGHRTNGSMGDGTSTNDNPNTFTYSTAVLIVCGTDVGPKVQKALKICIGKTANLADAHIAVVPPGQTLEWWTTPTRAAGTQVPAPGAVGPGTYYAFYIGGCSNPPASQEVLVAYYTTGEPGSEDCYCTKPGMIGSPDSYAKIGILTKGNITNSSTIGGVTTKWPENVPNGHIVLDGSGKGLVITHMTTFQRNALTPVDGMLIYNTDLRCVQLYRGNSPGVDASRTGWNCIKRGCNQ